MGDGRFAATQRVNRRPTTQEDSCPASEIRNIDSPDETRPFENHGHMDVVTFGDFTLGRGVFEPGWRWSTDVKPIAGTESCQVHHTGICLSGRMSSSQDNGTDAGRTGDVVVIEPGHDAWTVGDEACILLDTGVAAYAKPAWIWPQHDRGGDGLPDRGHGRPSSSTMIGPSFDSGTQQVRSGRHAAEGARRRERSAPRRAGRRTPRARRSCRRPRLASPRTVDPLDHGPRRSLSRPRSDQ